MKTNPAQPIRTISCRHLRRWRGTPLLLCAVLLAGTGLSRLPAEEATTFADGTLAEAQARAAKEAKVVFVDFFTTWCAPCKLLDTTTWQAPAVITLLREKTVALRVNAEKERNLAKQYRIDAYPTLLVLRPDGTEIDRYVGYLTADQFRETLEATLAGKTSLQTARDAAKADEVATPAKRMALARKLAEAGQHAEALEQYLWCYDSGPDADPRFARTLESSLPAQLGALGRNYPPAREALRARRDPLQQSVTADPKSAEIETVARLAALDLALQDDEAIISMLAKLPEGGRARKSYGAMPVLIRLVQTKHYGEALSLGVPETEYQKTADQATQAITLLQASGREIPRSMMTQLRRAPAMIGVIYVIALAGAGETERAQKLAETILRGTNDPEVRQALSDGLIEADAPELAAVLTAATPAQPQAN